MPTSQLFNIPSLFFFLLCGMPKADAAVRREAITALGLIGPAAAAAIPHLEKLAKDINKGIATSARAALKQIRKRPR